MDGGVLGGKGVLVPNWDLWAGELRISAPTHTPQLQSGTYSRGITGGEFPSKGHKIAKTSRKRAFPPLRGGGKRFPSAVWRAQKV